MKKVIVFSLFLLMLILWAWQGMVYAEEYILWSDTTQGQSNIPKRCKKIQGGWDIYVKNNSGVVSLLGGNYAQIYMYSITFSFDGRTFKTHGLVMSQEKRFIMTVHLNSEICVEGGAIHNESPGHPKVGALQIIVSKRMID